MLQVLNYRYSKILETLNMLGIRTCFAASVILLASITLTSAQSADDAYLTWTASQADAIGKTTRQTGKAGGNFKIRIISTNKAINYALRATLMTPEVIRASARVIQLRDRLSDEQTRKLVAEAESVGHLVIMVEINPNEGSGVIPLDWRVILQPKDLPAGLPGAITGSKEPQLRRMPVMAGLFGRNYEYDVFWVSFPLVDEKRVPLISPDLSEIQLIVGIYESEGSISWKMPESIRQKIRDLSKK